MSGGRQPQPIANLLLDGWEETARRVLRRVRFWSRPQACMVLANADVVMRDPDVAARLGPADAFVGTYTRQTPVNVIQDDLIARLRELAKPIVEAA